MEALRPQKVLRDLHDEHRVREADPEGVEGVLDGRVGNIESEYTPW
jgi:hypothetical protein